MSTKDDYLFLKGAKNVFVTSNNYGNQYSNLNLNESHKCFDSLIVCSKSKSKDFSNIEPTVFQNDLSWNKPSTMIKPRSIVMENLNIYNEAKKEVKKVWKDGAPGATSSTLSLHIAAYENSIGLLNEHKDSNKQISMAQRSKNESIKLLGESSKLQNSFEFPRQIKNTSTSPEVMQFKSSQKLFNPNNVTMLVSKLNTRISYRTRATYHQTKRTWTPRFVRRFFLQYPKSPAYIVVGIATVAMFNSYFVHAYKKMTLSKEEFAIYAQHFNEVTRARQKFGHDLYFPFYNDNKATTVPVEKSKPE